jgi:hypothetical protein
VGQNAAPCQLVIWSVSFRAAYTATYISPFDTARQSAYCYFSRTPTTSVLPTKKRENSQEKKENKEEIEKEKLVGVQKGT